MEDQQVHDYKKELDRFVQTSSTDDVQEASTSQNKTYSGPLLEEMPLLQEFLPKKDDSNIEIEPIAHATESNMGIGALLEQIRQRRDDSNVVSTPKANIDNANAEKLPSENQPEIIDYTDDKNFENLLDQIREENRKDFERKLETQPALNPEDYPNLDNLIKKTAEAIKEDVELIHEIDRFKKDILLATDQPQIEIDSETNSSMEHYFPKQEVTETEVKTGFNALFDQIKKRRDESNVVASPSITHLGLGVQDSPKVLSPLQHKPSFGNMFEDTMNLFDGDEDDNVQITQPEVNPQPINIPQEEITSELINVWDKITFEDNDKGTKIHFDDLWKNVESIHFSTNNGHLKSYDLDLSAFNPNPDTTNIFHIFKWKEEIGNTIFPNPTILKEIIIKDLQGNVHSIYKVNNQ